MVSAAVFLGIAGSHLGYPILDPAVAVIVAGIIAKQVSRCDKEIRLFFNICG
jgi:divalent metal cation (Fe/Co/Zn/Cd) transporter